MRFFPRVRNRSSDVACKPGPVPPPGFPGGGGDHSSRRRIAAPLEHSYPCARPVRDFGRATLDSAPIRACSGRGLPRRRSPGCRAWALTPRFQPYLCLLPGCLSQSGSHGPSAVWFLWRFPSSHPGSLLTTSLPCGARTFLSWAVSAHQRSSVHLRHPARLTPCRHPCQGPHGLPRREAKLIA